MSKFTELTDAQAEAVSRQEAKVAAARRFCYEFLQVFANFLEIPQQSSPQRLMFANPAKIDFETGNISAGGEPLLFQKGWMRTVLYLHIEPTDFFIQFDLAYDPLAKQIQASIGKTQQVIHMNKGGYPAMCQYVYDIVKNYIDRGPSVERVMVL